MLKTKYNFIYKTTNIINNKIYIGQHCSNKKDNFYLGSGIALKEAIKKYGKENFKREVIEYCLPCKYYINEREKYWIKELDSFCPNGYNISEGGKSGLSNKDSLIKLSNSLKIKYSDPVYKAFWLSKNKLPVLTEENRREHSEKMKGHIPWNKGICGTKLSDETRKKMSDARKGLIPKRESVEKRVATRRQRGNYGMSEENRKKQSERMKGRVMSEETKEKIRQSSLGRVLSEESIKKSSESRKGFRHSEETKEKIRQINLGKKRPPEIGKKISEANKGKIISQEQREKSSEFMKNAPILTCPYCGYRCNCKLSMTRWHFENCSKNPNYKLEDHLLYCPHCGLKTKSKTILVKYHLDNCKQNPNYKLEDHIEKCPYCGLIGGKGYTMHRYHFDNCKHKPKLQAVEPLEEIKILEEVLD